MVFALLILFFCFPLPLLLFAIPRIRDWRFRAVIWMFFVMVSYMLIPYEYGDIRLYADQMQHYSNYTFYQYLNELGKSLIGQGRLGFEFFVQMNLFIVSRFTTNAALSYCITATIVFLAWQAIIMRLLKDYDKENNYRNLIALGLLFFFGLYIIFIRAVNGRFYLAYWVFVYAFYKIIVDRQYKYHFLLFLTIYIHQSFIFLNVLVLVYRLTEPLQKIKRFELALYALILVAIAYAQTSVALISEYLGVLGGNFSYKYSAYLSEHYMDKVGARKERWFMEYRTPILFYSLMGNVILARLNKKIVFDRETTHIYYFVLIFWVVNSFTINVESFGDRFRNVLMGIVLILLFKIYNTNKVKFIPVNLIILTFAFVLYKVVTIRVLAGYIDVWVLVPFSTVMSWLFGPIPILS